MYERDTASGRQSWTLPQQGRATIVGERTGGGAHPRRGFTVHAHLELTVPVARPVDAMSGTNWERVGVAPDIDIPADQAFTVAYHRALDHVRRVGPDSPAAVEAHKHPTR
jgi:C-terminal processing protease CtpA/Prc